TLKLSKSTNQEWYEHVSPEVTRSQDGETRLYLVDDLTVLKNTSPLTSKDKGTSSSLKSKITTTYSQEKVKFTSFRLRDIAKGLLVLPSITVDGVTRLKEYTKLTPAEAIQADCDIKAINIILQGLPTEIYAFMPLEQFQVNTKFLNTLPDEWSKFVTDVKLVKDLHTTNVDQLHAHLEQHERHANEVRLMHESTINNGRVTLQPIQRRQTSFAASTLRTYTTGASGNNSGKQRMIICYNYKGKMAQLMIWMHMTLMANLSHYGSDPLAEVHNHDNMNNDVVNQALQMMPSSQQ
ncbi:hypothetical protein Tco_0168177, partial [Tanacetum coccineum]